MVARKGTWHGLKEIRQDFTNLSKTGAQNIKTNLMRMIAESCIEIATQYSPVDSGEYANGWYVITLTDTLVEIGNKQDELVDILERGTPPHRINARPGGRLVFEMDGQTIFTSYSNHPGTAPQPHIDKILKIMNELIIDFIQGVMAQSSPLFQTTGTVPKMRNTSNIAGIGGLGGANKNIGRGRIHITRVRTGRRILKRRIGLRRRMGHLISGANIKIG